MNNTNLLDVAVVAYNGAEVCQLVGLFLLNSLANKFDKNNVGLYRDDGLIFFKNVKGHRADKISKELDHLLKENGLLLEIECNPKTVNYLDITSDLNTGAYKRYCKPNDEIIYFHAKSNHPANILKQLLISIDTTLSNRFSHSEFLHEACKHDQNILKQSGYNYKLEYIQRNNENDNRSKSTKDSKRNV